MAVDAISHSKLLSSADDSSVLTVSNEDTGLTGSNKNETVLAVINIDTSCCIEETNGALLAVGYLKLLHV